MIINEIKKLIKQTIEDIYYSYTIIVDKKRCVVNKRIRNICIKEEQIDIGEEIVIYEKQWIEIVNEFPIKYSYKNKRDKFIEESMVEWTALDSRTIRAGDSCIIAPNGKVKVLGFVFDSNDDEKGTKILVSYSSHAGYCRETHCPSRAEFLIEPEEFIHLRKTFQNNKRR